MKTKERIETRATENRYVSYRLPTKARPEHREFDIPPIPTIERLPVREVKAAPPARETKTPRPRHYVRWLGLLGMAMLVYASVVVYNTLADYTARSDQPWTAESRGLVGVIVQSPWTVDSRGLNVTAPVAPSPWTAEGRGLAVAVQVPWTPEGRGLVVPVATPWTPEARGLGVMVPVEQVPWTPEGRGLVVPVATPWTPEARGLGAMVPVELAPWTPEARGLGVMVPVELAPWTPETRGLG